VTITTASATSSDTDYAGIDPSDVTVTNTDDDTAGIFVTPNSGLTTNESATTDSFTVVLTGAPTDDVSIAITSGNTDEVTVDQPSITFTTGNWDTAQTVILTGVNDGVIDGSITVTIDLAAATSADGNFDGIDPINVTVTNTDDDSSGITITPNTGLITDDSGTMATFTVVLDGPPTANVTIDLTSSDTGEVMVDSATLTFTTGDWFTAQTVTLTGQSDSIVDGNQSVTIATAAAVSGDGNYDGLDAADVSVTNNDTDAIGIAISPITGLVTTEAGGTTTFSAVLTTLPSDDVTVGVSSSDTTEALVRGGDSPGTAVSAITLTFTSGNWNTPQIVSVEGQDDGIDDGNQVFTITTAAASSTDGNYNGLNPDDVAVTNNDDDAAGISVTPISGLVTNEGGSTTIFTVVLDTSPSADVTINVSSGDISEALIKGGDSPTIAVASLTLTFTSANYATPQTVTLVGQNDAAIDGNQTFTITTAAAVSTDANYGSPASINAADVTATNNDDDIAGITVTPATGLVITETGGTDTFSVVLNSEPTATVTLDVTSGDTTEALVRGGDSPFTAVTTITLTFTTADWATAQIVTLEGEDDAIDDGDQVVTISTTAATSTDVNYSGLDASDVTATATDNDQAGLTVTPTSGLTTTEAGGTDTFSVVLNIVPTADVTVAITAQDTSEVLVMGGDSPSTAVSSITLTFTSVDWSTVQTVTVVGQDDVASDGNQITSVATGVTASVDSAYNGLNLADVSVSTSDDDAVGITISPLSGLTTTEIGGTATFSVSLNTQPTTATQVEILLVNGDTTEVSLSATNLTFTDADWSTPQTVTLTGVDDVDADGAVSVTIQTFVDTGATTDLTGYAGINPDDVTVTNLDDDVTGVTVTPTTLATSETGTSATFDVVLATAPTGTVTVGIDSGNTAEVLVDKALLVFSNSDWATAQTVTATGVDDGASDGAQVVILAVTVDSAPSDPTYAAFDPTDVTVTNADDDLADITITPTALTTSENGTTSTFSVSLSTAPTGDVVVDITANDGGLEVSLDKTALTFTTGDWATSQTVTVTGVNDGDYDGDIDVTLTFDNSGGADTSFTLVPGTITVTNQDNEATSEGTASDPLALDPATSLPYEGGAGPDDFSYYHLTNLTPGLSYLVSVSSVSDAITMSVYSDSALTTQLCTSSGNTTPVPETCLATLPGGVSDIYITVRGTAAGEGIGTSYTLAIIEQPTAGEGIAGTPVNIDADLNDPDISSYFGSVAPSAAANPHSYYEVTGLNSGNSYFVVLTGLSGDVDLEVYADADFTTQVCSGAASTITEACVTTTGYSSLFIKVISSDAIGAFFIIDVIDPPVDEGTSGSPINITGLIPYAGQNDTVQSNSASYYMIENLIPAAQATVSLTLITGDVQLVVYDDSTYLNDICTSSSSQDGGRVPETCVGVTVNPAGRLYIEVLRDGTGGIDHIGSTYILSVIQ